MNTNISVDEKTGAITELDKDQSVFEPQQADFSFYLTEFEILWKDGHYYINGKGRFNDQSSMCSVIGDPENISRSVSLTIHPEMFAQRHCRADWSEEKRGQFRCSIGFIAAMDADPWIDGSDAEWYASAYVNEVILNRIVESIYGGRIKKLWVTLELDNGLYEKDTSKDFIPDRDGVRYYLRPSERGNDPKYPESATGRSVKVSIVDERSLGSLPRDDTKSTLDLTLGKRLGQLQSAVNWLTVATAFLGFITLGNMLFG